MNDAIAFSQEREHYVFDQESPVKSTEQEKIQPRGTIESDPRKQMALDTTRC